MHLLPGLALFAHRYHTPTSLRGLQGLRDTAGQLLRGHRGPSDLGGVPPPGQPQQLLLWLVAAPLLFYITWQLLYFLIVQVGWGVGGSSSRHIVKQAHCIRLTGVNQDTLLHPSPHKTHF